MQLCYGPFQSIHATVPPKKDWISLGESFISAIWMASFNSINSCDYALLRTLYDLYVYNVLRMLL